MKFDNILNSIKVKKWLIWYKHEPKKKKDLTSPIKVRFGVDLL